MPGPQPSCSCGTCQPCRRRESKRRHYHGLAPLNPRRFAPGVLKVPAEAHLRAYIAGLLDGEGCITRQNGRLIVQVGMTHEGVIAWLGAMGGTVRSDPRRPPRKELFRWRVMRARDVLALLEAVAPYMRVRRPEADAAIEELRRDLANVV